MSEESKVLPWSKWNNFLQKYEWSVRTGNVLNMNGIDNIDKFLALTRDDVMAMPNAGRKTANEVEEMQNYITKEAPDHALYSLKQAVDLVNGLLPHTPEGTRLLLTLEGKLTIYRRVWPN